MGLPEPPFLLPPNVFNLALEYTIIVGDSADRHAAAPAYAKHHEHNILTMEKKTSIIVERLQEHLDREELGSLAVNAKVNLRGGLQRNIRELEVTLMSTAKVSKHL